MTRLVLLNGAPGSGKSTIARRFAEDHPLTLLLDIDHVQAMLGGWLDRPTDSGVRARELAIVMARQQLRTGYDVIVPQYLGRLAFIDTVHQLATEVGAEFVEAALVSDRDDVVHRFERRSATSDDPAHQQAAELQRGSGGREDLAATHDKLLAVLAARPATRTIITIDGDIAGTYQRFLAAIGAR